jgi:hypothetical protein
MYLLFDKQIEVEEAGVEVEGVFLKKAVLGLLRLLEGLSKWIS